MLETALTALLVSVMIWSAAYVALRIDHHNTVQYLDEQERRWRQ